MWEWFADLSAARDFVLGYGVGLAQPIRYTEIAAWASLMRIKLEPWEVRALRLVDEAAREEMNRKRSAADEVAMVSADDTDALDAMLRGMSTAG